MTPAMQKLFDEATSLTPVLIGMEWGIGIIIGGALSFMALIAIGAALSWLFEGAGERAVAKKLRERMR